MQTKVNWFEIPSTDFARAVKFYEAIFDTSLKIEQFSDGDMAVFASPDGMDVGAVVGGAQHKPNQDGPLIYLDATPGMDQVIARIEAAGGRVVMKKTNLPGELGYIAQFFDTEGNRVALHAMH